MDFLASFQPCELSPTIFLIATSTALKLHEASTLRALQAHNNHSRHTHLQVDIMSVKRKDTVSISDELRYAKRSRPSYEDDDYDDEPSTTSSYTEKPRNDPVYGQKNAFPGLDGPGSDTILYGPPEDGIEYLRMVR